jgi:hypothetical protein
MAFNNMFNCRLHFLNYVECTNLQNDCSKIDGNLYIEGFEIEGDKFTMALAEAVTLLELMRARPSLHCLVFITCTFFLYNHAFC